MTEERKIARGARQQDEWDDGVASERTVLAWHRSALSLLAVGALALRAGITGAPLALAANARAVHPQRHTKRPDRAPRARCRRTPAATFRKSGRRPTRGSRSPTSARSSPGPASPPSAIVGSASTRPPLPSPRCSTCAATSPPPIKARPVTSGEQPRGCRDGVSRHHHGQVPAVQRRTRGGVDTGRCCDGGEAERREAHRRLRRTRSACSHADRKTKGGQGADGTLRPSPPRASPGQGLRCLRRVDHAAPRAWGWLRRPVVRPLMPPLYVDSPQGSATRLAGPGAMHSAMPRCVIANALTEKSGGV